MAPVAADEVVRFLEENPGFFIEHPDLLRSSGLLEENSASARVLNLRDRLFDRLKGEREDLIHILDETIELVRRNEQIERDFLAIEKLLFEEAPSLARLSEIASEIERRFSLDHASFLLREPMNGISVLIPEDEPEARVRPMGKKEKKLAPMNGEPVLKGDLAEGAGPLFPEACRAELRSTGVVPLRVEEDLFGFLLLGSRDPARYAPGMATHLLERLAMRLALGLSLLKRLAPAPPGARSEDPPEEKKARRRVAS